MIKNLITAVLGLFLAASVTQANAIVWEVSPDNNNTTFSSTVVVGLDGELAITAPGTQDVGIFGAGFMLATAGDASVSFDADLTTWDSYNAPTVAGTGYYDAFIVMISDAGYYWDLAADPAWMDPVAANASTFVWGGENYLDGVNETYQSFATGGDTLTASGSDLWYVSFVLDTQTEPFSDNAYSSIGSFHVTAVPEPGTLLLLGGGLLGLTFTGRRKRNNS